MKKLGIIFSILILSLGILWSYLGGFTKMVVDEQELGPFYYMYKSHKGSYKKLGPLFQEMYALSKKIKFDTNKKIGVYYDDPEKIPAEQLRAEVGISLSPKEFETNKKDSNFDKFQFREIPKANYAHTTFPFKNHLSIYVALSKAYPALEKYLKEHHLHSDQEDKMQNSYAMEVYDPGLMHFTIKLNKTK